MVRRFWKWNIISIQRRIFISWREPRETGIFQLCTVLEFRRHYSIISYSMTYIKVPRNQYLSSAFDQIQFSYIRCRYIERLLLSIVSDYTKRNHLITRSSIWRLFSLRNSILPSLEAHSIRKQAIINQRRAAFSCNAEMPRNIFYVTPRQDLQYSAICFCWMLENIEQTPCNVILWCSWNVFLCREYAE